MEILNRRFDDLPCNAECLDKRAINQIILLNASLENRPLNAEEIDIIKQNWHGARYDKIDKDLKVKE